ncbi:MAG: hypothetical protein DRI86_11345, partial [Bacteroidetes bacterium]
QGPQGPAGPKGADGDTGPAGNNGADGAIGPQGPQGPAGPKGADGDTGPAGNNGADGAIGPQGAQGPAGPKGADGDTGPAGNNGADGAIGPQGPQGPAGPKGADGETGPQGPIATNTSDSITKIDHDAYGNINLGFNSDPTLTSNKAAVLIGGNLAGGAISIGTKNGNDIKIITDNADRAIIMSSGEIGINTNNPKSGVDINTSVGIALKTINSDYSPTLEDHVILCETSGGNITFDLPDATAIKGRKYIIKNIGNNGVKVIANGGANKIDGLNQIKLVSMEFIEVINDGNDWYIISQNK